jgi:hypothetical protein
MPSSLLQVVNSLFQTCYNNWEQAARTQLVDSLWTDFVAFLRVYCLRTIISQLGNNMCSHCLFPVVDKSGTKLLSTTESQQVVPTNLILCITGFCQVDDNKLVATCYEQPVLVLLQQLVASLLCNKMITTCSRLVTTTGNHRYLIYTR